jgi:hypothetical protein
MTDIPKPEMGEDDHDPRGFYDPTCTGQEFKIRKANKIGKNKYLNWKRTAPLLLALEFLFKQ